MSRSSSTRPKSATRWWWPVALVVLVSSLALAWLWRDPVAAPELPKPPAEPVVVAVPAGAVQPEVPARAMRTIRGRVIGLDGRGLAGVSGGVFRVTGASSILPRQPEMVWHSGDDGHFVTEVDFDRDLAVAARTSGMISTLVAVGDGRRELIVPLYNAFDLRGYVTDGSMPAVNCEVLLLSEEGRFVRAERTDENGAFRFAQVLPGQVTLEARSTRFRPATVTGVAVGSREAVTLEFREGGLGMHGRVLFAGDETTSTKGGFVRATPMRREGVRTRTVPHTASVRDDGSFELFGLGPGPHRIEIGHEQRSTVIRQVDLEGVLDLGEVRLPLRTDVRGRLTAETPVTTELLLVTEAGERARVRTDPAGRFEFSGRFSVGPASLVLTDRALVFERSSSRRAQIEVGGDQIALTVNPALLLFGEVVDAAGRKVSGAEVFVDSDRVSGVELLYEPAAVSDAEGRYRLHVAGNQPVQLTVMHPAHAGTAVLLPRQASGPQQPIVLYPPRKLSGAVRRNGRPLAAAIVHLGVDSQARAWATTDQNGLFVMQGVRPGVHNLFVRYGSLGDFAYPEPVEVAQDRDVVDLRVDLPAARSVDGRVVDPQGQPLAGVLVSVAVAGGGAVPTDGGGNFRLDAPQGAVELRAFAPEWRIEARTTAAPSSGPLRIELPVPPHGRLLAQLRGIGDRRPSGCVLRIGATDDDAEGDRLKPQWVDMREGELNFARFPVGRRRVEIVCSGYAPHVIDVNMAAGERFDAGLCVLEPGARVRGVVVDSGGRPVPGARVVLGSELDLLVADEVRRARGEDVFGTRADARGRFELLGVTSRSATLVASAEGFAPSTRSLALPADVLGREPVQVALGEGVAIVVEVIDARGQPVRGAAVDLRKDGFSVAESRTDARGRCTFPHLALGDHEVDLVGMSLRAVVEVYESRTYHVELRAR